MQANTKADREELRRLVADVLDVDPSEVTSDANFIRDLGVDSLIALELAVTLERHYGVRFTEREIIGLRCLDDIVALLQTKLAR